MLIKGYGFIVSSLQGEANFNTVGKKITVKVEYIEWLESSGN